MSVSQVPALKVCVTVTGQQSVWNIQFTSILGVYMSKPWNQWINARGFKKLRKGFLVKNASYIAFVRLWLIFSVLLGMVHREKQSRLILFFQKSVFDLVWKFIFLRKDHHLREKASPIEKFHWKFVNKTKPTRNKCSIIWTLTQILVVKCCLLWTTIEFSVGKR